VGALSEKAKIAPEKAREIRERTKDRTLILQEMKNRGPSTVDELAQTTGMEKPNLLKHLIAMRQFGKVSIDGEREGQLLYSLPKQ